jgi:hypothetical protein
VVGGLEGGQPENLNETIGLLYDYNGKVVNWLLLDSAGGEGGGDQILFRVVDVVCEPELYVVVEWTHYTGCGVDPPDTDPYTGYINVYDSCVLAYYTVDYLLSGATGRATYWYPRDSYCMGKWIVDSICGQPECS